MKNAFRILRALVIAAVFAVVVLVGSNIGSAGTKSFEITHADVNVELQRDSSIIVTERLTFDFTGDFSGAYREFPLNGDARVTDVQVSEASQEYRPGGNTALGSFDAPGTFGVRKAVGAPVRIVWHYDASDEVRTFDVAYRVVDATSVHPDTVDVSWTVWGDQWDFWLDDLDASISAASGAAPEEAWFRPRSLGEAPEVGEDATVSAERLREGETAGLRAVFPRDAVQSTGGGAVVGSPGLPDIESEEARLDQDYGFFDKLQNFASDNRLPLSLLIAGLALLATAILALLARERPSSVGEYESEPPEEIPPALAFALAREGDYDKRLVLATLLDLVDRGYYESRMSSGTEDLDLEIKYIPADQRPKDVLESYEVATLDFFDKLLGNNWVGLSAMSDRIPKHSSSWRSRWEDLNEKLESAEDGQISWERDFTGWRLAIAAATVLLLGLVTLLCYERTHHLEIPLIALVTTLLLMYALPSTTFKRMMVGPRERQARWSAFERWTRDFPRLDDDPPSTLKLWRRILVYAVAFDTADRVVKSGRIPEPVAEEAASSGFWTGYVVSPGFGDNDFDGFASGFSSQVAPESSSGSSGGGFSGGGGGGFSGGGGGGAW